MEIVDDVMQVEQPVSNVPQVSMESPAEEDIFAGVPYKLEKRLLKKMKIMCDRCTDKNLKKDALLVNEGGEGEGKTNSSIAEAGVIKHLTGREIHLFFKAEQLIKFAQNNEEKIIIYDEPSLDTLSTDQMSSLVKNLLRLFMTVRKKRHFFILNLTKFYKFPEYLVVDRSLGMVHMYSRKEIEAGRFVYVKKKNLEELWTQYTKGKKRSYGKLASFRGKFPEVMNKHFKKLDVTVNGRPHATLKVYEEEKDKAIQSIGEKKTKQEIIAIKKLNSLRFLIAQFHKETGVEQQKIAKLLKIHPKRLREWAQINPESTDLLEKEGFEEAASSHINTIRVIKEDSPLTEGEREIIEAEKQQIIEENQLIAA